MKRILLLFTLLCSIFAFSNTADAKIIHSLDELPQTVSISDGEKVATPTLKGYCGQKVRDIKFPDNGWYWIIDNATLNKILA